MVRVNCIHPKRLADQHLVAECNELLMLAAYIRSHPNTEGIPTRYRLGPGHMRFFKDKILFLQERHDALRNEMQRRGFKTVKRLQSRPFPKANRGYWTPDQKGIRLNSCRIAERIRQKPGFYRYEGKVRDTRFFLNLLGRHII